MREQAVPARPIMKRLKHLLLGAALTAAAAFVAAPQPAAAGVLGDVNGDGVVDIKDVQVLSDYLVGNSTYVPHPENADVNGDGVID
ncbi:MAG: hypothetical protein HKL90_09695, partial [Elusimicrobia bacterium]|nr:hypothetical protein [Elusimicrobiota bacterium]